MGKLIAKTALITLGGLIALCLILWGIFSWLAPSVMLTITDGLGLDAASAHYSVSVYQKTEKIEDLSRAVEKNYACGKYSVSAKYGEKLLEREDFSAYCEKQGGNYRQIVSGIAAVSLYETDEGDKALELAEKNTAGEFQKYNCLERLLNAAMEKADKPYVEKIRAAVAAISLDPADTEGAAHRDEVLAVCDAFLK